MKSIITAFRGVLLFCLAIIAFWGCSATEVQTELPIYHPANPEASEAVYTAPPNPFAEETVFVETDATDGHTGHGEKPMSEGMSKKSMGTKEMPHESHAKPMDGGQVMDHKN